MKILKKGKVLTTKIVKITKGTIDAKYSKYIMPMNPQ